MDAFVYNVGSLTPIISYAQMLAAGCGTTVP
jgi:hypothetical protein